MSIILQSCADCGAVNYPAREVCRRCLGERIERLPVSGRGTLLARTVLHASGDPFFRERLPWRIGSVKLDVGPVIIVHLGDGVGDTGQTVELQTTEQDGKAMLIAELSISP
jgi:uncharacterized OB-fold protein